MKPPASDLPYTEDPNGDLCEMIKSREDVSRI